MVDFTVNRDLVPIKLLYFLYYGGLSSFIPFKSIYQKQLGMSSAQNGIIQATMQLVSLVSPPIAGIITDKTKAYKIMLATLMFFSIAFTIPFYFVPPEESASPEVTCCQAVTDSIVAICPANSVYSNITSCSPVGNHTFKFDSMLFEDCERNGTLLKCSVPFQSTDSYGQTFAVLVILTALMSFFLSPVTPLVDSSAMDTLGMSRVDKFGNQRLWGAVGFGMVGLCVTYLTDLISPPEIYGQFMKNYTIAFGSVALFWGCAILVMVVSVKISAPKAKGILNGLGRLLMRVDILFFLCIVLVSGFSTGVQYSFVFWYLQDFEDFGQFILGLSMVITCASEIPMFWISGWICSTLGYVSVLSLGLCAVAVRFFVYTVITEAWHILLIEWLHGVSFALPMAAMCSYATVMAPKDAVATLISFSQTVYWGIGNALGALLGGLLYQAYGGKSMFRISCGICLASALLYWAFLGPFGIFKLVKSKTTDGKNGVAASAKVKKAASAEEEPLHEQLDAV